MHSIHFSVLYLRLVISNANCKLLLLTCVTLNFNTLPPVAASFSSGVLGIASGPWDRCLLLFGVTKTRRWNINQEETGPASFTVLPYLRMIRLQPDMHSMLAFRKMHEHGHIEHRNEKRR